MINTNSSDEEEEDCDESPRIANEKRFSVDVSRVRVSRGGEGKLPGIGSENHANTFSVNPKQEDLSELRTAAFTRAATCTALCSQRSSHWCQHCTSANK